MALISSLRDRSQSASGMAILLGVVLLAVWLVETPAGLLGKADAIGYAVCHRIDLRSFHLGERALPLCSRCTGTYLGVGIAFLLFGFRRGKTALYPPKQVLIPLGVFAIGYRPFRIVHLGSASHPDRRNRESAFTLPTGLDQQCDGFDLTNHDVYDPVYVVV
jgi:hypothetical protein